jgi:hypothetical protein
VLTDLTAEVDFHEHRARGQLNLLVSRDAYFSEGTFSTNGMLDFWDQGVRMALVTRGSTSSVPWGR